jgi:hypothetical protein
MCNFRTQDLNKCSNVLRSITLQIVKGHRNLSSFVLDDYVNHGISPTRQTLKKLLPLLLSNIDTTRLVVDGLDECADAGEQKNIVVDVLELVRQMSAKQDCKVLFFSRNVPSIEKYLKTYPTISLRDTIAAQEMEKSIRVFTKSKIEDLRNDLEDICVSDDLFEEAEEHIARKADGIPNTSEPESQ